jgi:hypothetical protein
MGETAWQQARLTAGRPQVGRAVNAACLRHPAVPQARLSFALAGHHHPCGWLQAGAELTLDFTPLEAGLYHACSLAKGCYIGQERLAQV